MPRSAAGGRACGAPGVLKLVLRALPGIDYSLYIRGPLFVNSLSRRSACAKAGELSESPRHIIFGQLLGRIREDALGWCVLDELAQPEKRGSIRHSCRLLHVVRHDHNRIR